MAEITIRISDKVLKATLAVLSTSALVLALSYFGSLRMFRPKYQIKMFVPEAQGIGVGAPVSLGGISVGGVSEVKLAENPPNSNRKVELVLRIEKRYQSMIRGQSSATLVTEGLLGNRYVDIQPGLSGRPINSGEEIRSVPAKEIHISDLANAIGKVADSLNCEKEVPDGESRSGASKLSPNTHVSP